MSWSVFRKAVRLLYSKRPDQSNSGHLLQKRLTTIGGFIFQLRWTDILSIRGIFDKALCSDPRNRIHGIRFLLFQDQQGLCGTPDYTTSSIDVYSKLTRNYITKNSNGLTILRQCELLQVYPRWSGPSWVPDWSNRASFHWGSDTRASSQIKSYFAFPDIGTLEVLGVSRTAVQKTQPIPKFHGRDWAEGVDFLKTIAADIDLETSYSSGGTLVRALARTVLYGLISDFSFIKDGNFPTTEIAEAVFTRFASGVGLVK